MTLWDWSLAAWRRDGVEAAAIARQDSAGDSVALILWQAWSGVGDSTEARAMAEAFEVEVLGPLRQARRALKDERTGFEMLKALHGEVRSAELAAERVLLEALEQLAPDAGHDAEAGFARLDRALGL